MTSKETTFNELCIERHNYYRKKHKDTGLMTLSQDVMPKLNDHCILFVFYQQMIDSATKKAQELATTSVIERTSKKSKLNIGENLWSTRTSDGATRVEHLSCEEPIKEWYSENKYYVYGVPYFTTSLTQHFTQIVWKSTKEVGCAKSYSSSYAYVVCHYRPKGNIFSKYKSNIGNRFG